MFDELSAGVPTAGSPDIERAFALDHASLSVVIFVVPAIVALVIEPIVFLLADRYPRKWFIAGGLAVMAVGSFAAALAPSASVLAFAISGWAVATGTAAALAQGTLVDRAPDRRAQTMARWTLVSLFGDLLAPLVLAGLAAVGLGWRTAFVISGGVLAVWCVAVVATPFTTPANAPSDEREPALWASLRAALGDRVLLLWLFGTALCDLLDEILVVFASLHVRNELHASIGWQSAIITTFVAGGALGLTILDRLLGHHSERKLMIAISSVCAGCYVLWLLAPALWMAVVLMVPLGATAACLYPLAAARAYARCPGRSGVVLAASHLFTPFGLALPWLLGLVADRAGTWVALALLVVQPLGLAVLAFGDRDSKLTGPDRARR